MLRRRYIWIVVAVVLALAAGGLYLKRQVPSYTAASSVALATSQNQQQANVAIIVKMVHTTKVITAAGKDLGITPMAASGAVTATADANSPAVIDLSYQAGSSSSAVNGANAFAAALVKLLSDQTQAQIDSLKAQLGQFEARITTLQNQVNAHPNNQAVQAELTAEVAQLTATNDQISTLTLAGAPASVLQEATGAASNASSKVEVIGLAALIGLLVGCGCVLLWDQFDTRLRTVAEMEDVSDEAALVELPYDRSCRGRGNVLPVVDKPRTPLAGSMRELRTAVQVLLGDAECPVLAVTSPVPLDGKTLVAANLAASWALSGKRTVVVSGDLRRPQMDTVFGVAGSKGLAELIEPAREGTDPLLHTDSGPSGEDVAALLLETQVDGLRLLPAGTAGSEPADTVAGTVMPAVLKRLRSQADIIIVDTPPVLAVPDAAIIGALADGVLVVARSGKTKAEMLAETVRRLRSGGVRLLGLAVNQSRSATSQSYSGYYGTTQSELPIGRHSQPTD